MKLYEVSPQCVGWKIFNTFDCASNGLFCANCFANNAGDPETPAAGYVAIYAKSNSIHQKNSSGVVTDLGAGGGGSTLWCNIAAGFICPCSGCSICSPTITAASCFRVCNTSTLPIVFGSSWCLCCNVDEVIYESGKSQCFSVIDASLKNITFSNGAVGGTLMVCVEDGGLTTETCLIAGTCVSGVTTCGTTCVVSPCVCGTTRVHGAELCAGVSGVQSAGPIVVADIIRPSTTNTRDLGTITTQWRCVITCSMRADDQINIKDTIPIVTCVYFNGDATHRWLCMFTVFINCSSDCTQKEILSEFDGNKILEGYTKVPIYDWCWCNRDKTKTVGITAQDFSRSFGELVDLDSCTSINGTTHDGLQDAAIKELTLCVKKLEAQLGGKDNGNNNKCS